MGKAKREVEAMTLKDQTKKRLDNLRTNAELCLTNLDNLRARIRNAATNTGSEGALGSDLEAFYEKTKDNVSDIKEAADALSLEAPTAKAIEKLETAVKRALDDYSTYNAHLNALSNDVLKKKDSTKREMVFIAKETGIKIGRILSDLGKSATSFIMSWLKSTKEETARIQEIHKSETTGVEGVARAVGGTVAQSFNVLRTAVAQVVPPNVVSSIPSIPPVAPVLPALKEAAENLQARMTEHDRTIVESLRELESLRSPNGQPIVHAQQQKAPTPQGRINRSDHNRSTP